MLCIGSSDNCGSASTSAVEAGPAAQPASPAEAPMHDAALQALQRAVAIAAAESMQQNHCEGRPPASLTATECAVARAALADGTALMSQVTQWFNVSVGRAGSTGGAQTLPDAAARRFALVPGRAAHEQLDKQQVFPAVS